MASPIGSVSMCLVLAIPDAGLIYNPTAYETPGFNKKNSQNTSFRLPESLGLDPPSNFIAFEIKIANNSIRMPTIGNKI